MAKINQTLSKYKTKEQNKLTTLVLQPLHFGQCMLQTSIVTAFVHASHTQKNSPSHCPRCQPSPVEMQNPSCLQ